MNAVPKLKPAPTQIRRLPATLVNQIAAGEVIERPASVVKELVENALDAGANDIEVALENGGATLIRVRDNGRGMGPEDIALAVERHATSKLPDDDLLAIHFMGFRGEALPSIGSIARLRITSKQRGSADAYSLSVEGGEVGQVTPASLGEGTLVEVRDLFYAIPARLKFLKSARTEITNAVDLIERLAMAHPDVRFRISHDGRMMRDFPALTQDWVSAAPERLEKILGAGFAANTALVEGEREGIRVTGFAGLPTFNKSTSQAQYLFVNRRPVRDRLLLGVIRAAYMDYLARDRHPVAVLFLEVPTSEVDVNVHPAKAEVRFRDSQLVRGLLLGSLKAAIGATSQRASTTVAEQAMNAFTSEFSVPNSRFAANPRPQFTPSSYSGASHGGGAPPPHSLLRARDGTLRKDCMHQRRRFGVARRCRCRRAAIRLSRRWWRRKASYRWAPRWRSCITRTSWRRRKRGWWWWISMRRMSALCMRSLKLK